MGFGEAMAKMLLRKRATDEDAEIEAKKKDLEAVNKTLPKPVNAQGAIEKKRKQLADIDKMLEEK